MILYVIRHGETAWNKVRRLQGQTDIPLAEEGIRLAKETGIGMKDIPIDLVISSPLQRALQTADCITEGRNIPILTDTDEKMEIGYIKKKNMPLTVLGEKYIAELKKYKAYEETEK